MKSKIIKTIWIIVALSFGAYLFNSCMDDKAKRESERAEAIRIEQATKSAVAQLVSRTGAIDDWESQLSDGQYVRINPIFTIELEKLWIQNKPILFIGFIKDIATLDQLHYVVSIERNPFGSSELMLSTGLQLSLVVTKERMDSFLARHPNDKKVAVVARITAIRTIYVPGENGEGEEVKIGDGELAEIMCTGNVEF